MDILLGSAVLGLFAAFVTQGMESKPRGAFLAAVVLIAFIFGCLVKWLS